MQMKLENSLLSSIRNLDIQVKDVWVGLFWTAIESNYIGMSHTYKTGQKIFIKDEGELSSFSAVQLAERILSWKPLEASIGMAALNSLIKPEGEPSNIKDFIINNGRGKTISVIGRFPFNDEISEIAGKSYFLEMDPEGDELPPQACEDVLPKSDIIVITATALINHTLQQLLELGKNGINIVLGPSTPMSPILFDFGADILAGVKVIDKNALLKSVTQGVKKFRLLKGIEPICLYKNNKKGR